MPRPAGVRNQDFEQKRELLLEKLTDFMMTEGVELPSLRQMAIAAETSEPTIRHYFHDRTGVVIAVLERIGKRIELFSDDLEAPKKSFEGAINDFYDLIVEIRKTGVSGSLHGFGMRESLNDKHIQKAYLEFIIIPSVKALATRLVNTKDGPSSYPTAVHAARLMTSSSLLTIMFQEVLGGGKHFPLDINLYFEHTRNWMLRGMIAEPDGLGEGA